MRGFSMNELRRRRSRQDCFGQSRRSRWRRASASTNYLLTCRIRCRGSPWDHEASPSVGITLAVPPMWPGYRRATIRSASSFLCLRCSCSSARFSARIVCTRHAAFAASNRVTRPDHRTIQGGSRENRVSSGMLGGAWSAHVLLCEKSQTMAHPTHAKHTVTLGARESSLPMMMRRRVDSTPTALGQPPFLYETLLESSRKTGWMNVQAVIQD